MLENLTIESLERLNKELRDTRKSSSENSYWVIQTQLDFSLALASILSESEHD